jgi:glycosyltransferase involved in cell wall biosynthesis
MKLNLGCGRDPLPGWVNVDRSPACRPDVVHDPARLPWPFQDGCAEEVLVQGLPEAPEGGGLLALLAELHRVCAPGAVVRFAAGEEAGAAAGIAFRAHKPAGAQAPRPAPAVRWEGSQFTYQSLAHVNRQLCLGLLRTGQVDLSLAPTEPARFDADAEPAFRPLAARVNRALGGPVQVHVRHQWQPRFDPPAEGAWVMIQPWEYGGIPQEWIAPMRDQVDEIWVPTAWLKDCYVRSGIPEDKVAVVPNGVDGEVFRPDGERFPLRTRKGCKFLYLGYTIHRKGIDVLLEAYVRAFRAHDDVCLVIKGQGSGGYGAEDLPAILARFRAEDPQGPEIEYRADDLDETQVAALYRSCDALVLPYRGESFGLPIVEAMASGLPPIVTGRGAAMDYLRGDCAYLVPSRTVPVQGPMGLTPGPAGFWLEEPDPTALAELLRRAYLDPAGRREKGRRGREHALAELGWDKPAAIALERLERLAARQRD